MDWFLYDNGLHRERVNPANIYLFKVNNKNTRKTPEKDVKYVQS